MPSSRASTERADAGSASIEFLAAGLLLLLPVVALVVVLARIEAASFAVDGAARQAARIVASADDLGRADEEIALAIDLALADHGLASDGIDYAISCRPVPGNCTASESVVTVTLALPIALPLAPPGLDLVLPEQLTVTAEATEKRTRFGA